MTDRAKPINGSVPDNAFDVAVDMLTREQRRSRRKREVRAQTISIRSTTKRELRQGAQLYPEAVEGRPRTRGECGDVPRPCPYVGCKFNLFLDVTRKTGSIKLNFPDLEPWDLVESCALDVADIGDHTLEHVAGVTNLTRERVRQVEVKAFRLLRQLQDAQLEEHVDGDERTPVRDVAAQQGEP